jgi:glycosyltransferase involved in cell wall biosynthesis
VTERLSILNVSTMPASPPRFGAQARIHGLLTGLAKNHDVTAMSLVDAEHDVEECRRAMSEYCREVVLMANPLGKHGLPKRALQARSLASVHSFERLRYDLPEFAHAVERRLRSQRFDVVNLELPYMGHLPLKLAPPGAPEPPLVIDTHEIAYDIVRQFARGSAHVGRRLYGELNWRKLKRDELSAFRRADGLCACSVADQERILADVPTARTVVIPNAADVEYYRPRPEDPAPDGVTLVYFGLMSTVPNIDGIKWFISEIWPRVSAARPDVRLQVLGKGAPKEVLDLAGPKIEMTGLVPDLRPYLAKAALLVVPLRLGGGTRLKIVEGMAMAKAMVSTRLGAEGIDVVDDRHLMLRDEATGFADAVLALLADPERCRRLGAEGRALAEQKYAWSGAAARLVEFYRELLPGGARGVTSSSPAARTP